MGQTTHASGSAHARSSLGLSSPKQGNQGASCRLGSPAAVWGLGLARSPERCRQLGYRHLSERSAALSPRAGHAPLQAGRVACVVDRSERSTRTPYACPHLDAFLLFLGLGWREKRKAEIHCAVWIRHSVAFRSWGSVCKPLPGKSHWYCRRPLGSHSISLSSASRISLAYAGVTLR